MISEASHTRSVHPHYLSVYASKLPISARVPYTTAATLDTGRVASAYPGGSHTRLSSSHFQSARAFFGYAAPSSISSGA